MDDHWKARERFDRVGPWVFLFWLVLMLGMPLWAWLGDMPDFVKASAVFASALCVPLMGVSLFCVKLFCGVRD